MLCALAMLTVASAVPAQDKIVRKAHEQMIEVQNLMANKERKPEETAKMTKLLDETIQLIEPTLTSPDTKKELANAWDIKSMLLQFRFSPLLDNVINKQPTDTTALANDIYATLDAIEECYKATQALGLKGEKDPYTQKNKVKAFQFRSYVAYCGQMFFQNGQHKKAVDAFKRWMEYPQRYTILAGEDVVVNDESTPQMAYFTCLASYFAKDYKTLEKYIGQARTFEKEKAQANQLYMTALIEQGDTTAWLKAGREIVLEDMAENEAVAQNLLAYYFNRGKFDQANQFVDEMLAAEPDSRIANYAKGLVLMNNKKYAEAIKSFDHAAEIDSEFSDAYYNAGVCYCNIGYDINDALEGKKMTQAQYNAAIKPVKDNYAKAEPYFLKVRELEPNNSDKWASRLSTIYYILEQKDKKAEMDKYLDD